MVKSTSDKILFTSDIAMLQNIGEQMIIVNYDVHVCFIDYCKTFDKVRCNKLFNFSNK